MIIIGIDPGTATTGYGIIKVKKKKNNFQCLEYGIIKTDPSFSPQARLKKLYLQIAKILRKYQPKLLVLEKLYFFKNLKTAIPVAQAQGVILLAASKRKIEVKEFTPLEVKMGICGYGRAQKIQIQKMVKKILNLKEIPKPDDAGDALAVAICGSLIFKKSKPKPKKG